MKRLCILMLILAMPFSFAACGKEIPDSGTTEPATTTNAQTTESTEPEDTLSALRAGMGAKMIAVADFGFPELSEDFGIMDHLLDRYPQWLAEHEFVRDMPEERIILTCDYDTRANLVCIVPKDPAATVRVNVTRYIDVSPYEKWDVVYTGEAGEPILLLADYSDSVRITVDITDSRGQETTWHPYNSGNEPFRGDAYIDDFAMDFSPVSDPNTYQNALDEGWVVPDESFRKNHYWQSDYGYQLELYYNPGEVYDGIVYLYDYSGTDAYGDEYYTITWQGYWIWVNGKLHLNGDGFEGEFPILTTPDGKDSLRIFCTEESDGLLPLSENTQYDELRLIATDAMSPYDYALYMGWRLPELAELLNTCWRSPLPYYAMDLNEDGVPGDNAGEVIFYDVSESGAYTQSYTGTWSYADGMLHLLMIPENNSGQFVDDSFPVLMLYGKLMVFRNQNGNGLPYFYTDTQASTLIQSVG